MGQNLDEGKKKCSVVIFLSINSPHVDMIIFFLIAHHRDF